MADWFELPRELLELVGDRIDNSSDTRRFRAVCSSWRSSVTPLLQQTPTHFLPIEHPNSSKAYHCNLLIIKRTTFCLSIPSKPNSSWLITTEEHKPGVLRLFSPFSRKKCKKTFMIKTLELTNKDIYELSYEYVLRNSSVNDHILLNNMEHEKVAVIHLPRDNDNNNNNDNDDDNNNVVGGYILLSTDSNTGKLLIYRSNNANAWSFLEDETLGYGNNGIFAAPLRYVDVVVYKGRFVAVTDYGRTVVIKVGENSLLEFTLLVKSITGGGKKCLVKSGDDLLLVDLYTCPMSLGSFEVHAIEVYKLDLIEGKWVLLESLGDRAIFLSDNSSFSTCGLLKGVKTNCVYFYFSNLENGCDFEAKGKKGDGNDQGCGNEDEFIRKGKKGDGNDQGCGNEDEFIIRCDEIGAFDYENGRVGSLRDYLEDDAEFFHCSLPS